MVDYLCCPNCKAALKRGERSYVCARGHSFDISKAGHTNLLLPGDKSTKLPGDNAEMISARRKFLSLGHFAKLANFVSELGLRLLPQDGMAVDAGCGEGYYDNIFGKMLAESGISAHLVCMDISKIAVSRAAKLCHGCGTPADFVVGSTYAIPVLDGCADVILNIFAPHCPAEFGRILKRNCHVLTVVPAKKHLWELKSLLYNSAYENPPAALDYAGFKLCKIHNLEYVMALDNAEVNALFEMTPYAYKTPPEAKAKLQNCDGLNVTASFEIWDFEKI